MLYLTTVMHQRRTTTAQRCWSSTLRVTTALAAGALCLLLSATRLSAHEIPQRVAVRAFVQQEGRALRLLVRVPLESMRDVDFPLRDDGSLDLVRVRTLLGEAAQTWLVSSLSISANGQTLAPPRIAAARVSLPNDRSFSTFEGARESFRRDPLEAEVIPWQQVLFDVALEYALPAADVRLVLHPDVAHLGVRTSSVVHVIGANGRDRVLTYDGNPEGIALDPAWYQTAVQFVREGFRHIMGGIDHLLFVVCLVLPVRRWQSLVTIVTAFTVAHSLTLGAAVLGFAPTALWFPPLVETLIAASIVWLAIENIVLPPERLSTRWPVAFGFGLIHGFGFSFALSQTLQFAGDNLVSALASFNIGVEAGQLAALAVAIPALWAVHRYAGATRDRVITIVGSVLVGHTAWHWLIDRGAALAEYRGSLAWPTLDAAFALGVMRAALLAAVALAVALAMRQILRVPRRS